MLHLSGLTRLREDLVREHLSAAQLEELWQEAEARAKERRQLEGAPDLLRAGLMEVRASGLAEIGELQEAARLFEQASALRWKKDDLDARKRTLFETEERARIK